MTPNTGWKVLSHDFRPPLRGGEPVWDGATFPFRLPKVKLDTGTRRCGPGWHYTDDLATAIRVTGLWPCGHPVCCLAVEPSEDAVSSGVKRRCSQLMITRRATEDELLKAIETISFFGEHQERMVASQASWYEALGRPGHDEEAVVQALAAALEARGLGWRLRRYEGERDARDAWAARAAWAAWAAQAAWAVSDTRAARAAWDAWDAQDAQDAWIAWDAWAAWDALAAQAAWGALAARAARDALTVEYASLQGWVDYPAELLTVGLRDAYRAGLGAALPIEEGVLGWSMLGSTT